MVEGHGEVRAALNLVNRFWKELELPFLAWSDPPIRGLKLHTREGILKACTLVRSKPDASALLILRDEDDGCPARLGPEVASWVRDVALPFPVACVLAHREFEAWFLPCLAQMAGRPLVDERGVERAGLIPGTSFSGNPEGIRGVKEWLSRHMPSGRSYKPTTDQLPLTRMIDLAVLRAAEVPSFGTLERALRFLAACQGRSGVYPGS